MILIMIAVIVIAMSVPLTTVICCFNDKLLMTGFLLWEAFHSSIKSKTGCSFLYWLESILKRRPFSNKSRTFVEKYRSWNRGRRAHDCNLKQFWMSQKSFSLFKKNSKIQNNGVEMKWFQKIWLQVPLNYKRHIYEN